MTNENAHVTPARSEPVRACLARKTLAPWGQLVVLSFSGQFRLAYANCWCFPHRPSHGKAAIMSIKIRKVENLKATQICPIIIWWPCADS